MARNEILDDVYRNRDNYAKKRNYSVKEIFEDLKKTQEEKISKGEKYVSYTKPKTQAKNQGSGVDPA